MHYKNGREAKVGDFVVGKDWQGFPISGVVAKTLPGASTCNIQIAPLGALPNYNSGDFLHLDDALAVPQPSPPEPEPLPQVAGE